MKLSQGIAIIVDVPACGSYDLFLQRPELFVKDPSGQPIIPSDWTDVRLLDAGDENKINKEVLRVYEEFVDYMISLGVDGIRADVAHCKPARKLFIHHMINCLKQDLTDFMEAFSILKIGRRQKSLKVRLVKF